MILIIRRLRIHRITDETGIAVIVVDHTTKQFSKDFLDDVRGSIGISGAADTIAILRKM